MRGRTRTGAGGNRFAPSKRCLRRAAPTLYEVGAAFITIIKGLLQPSEDLLSKLDSYIAINS